jgi:hypothetical protein
MGADVTEIAKLRDPESFEERFIELLPMFDTYEEAYEAVEDEYYSLFRSRKYAHYESFRISRHNRNKRNKRNR